MSEAVILQVARRCTAAAFANWNPSTYVDDFNRLFTSVYSHGFCFFNLLILFRSVKEDSANKQYNRFTKYVCQNARVHCVHLSQTITDKRHKLEINF